MITDYGGVYNLCQQLILMLGCYNMFRSCGMYNVMYHIVGALHFYEGYEMNMCVVSCFVRKYMVLALLYWERIVNERTLV